MANDEPTSGIVSTPKGGLYGGIFDPTGLGIDPNTLALLVDARWTTTFHLALANDHTMRGTYEGSGGRGAETWKRKGHLYTPD